MPYLYLSPSTQQFNPYVTTGNEEYWMNRLADELEPFLRASAVNFMRNDPNTSASAAIRESNAGNYDFHLALHSNAAGAGNAGNVRGIDLYYYPTSRQGLAMANILTDNLRKIYPLPEKVRPLTSTAIGEVRLTKAPAVLAELGYHDNIEDAKWIEGSLPELARAIALSVTEYFGLPFLAPLGPQAAMVVTSGGNLNLRTYPDPDSGIYTTIPNGAQLMVYGKYNDWYSVMYAGVSGFAAVKYLKI